MSIPVRIALLVGTICVIGLGYWLTRPNVETETDALALLAEEWRSINCHRGTSASELIETEARTLEILSEMEQMLESEESSDAAQQLQVRMMDLIRCNVDGLESPSVEFE